MKKLSDLKANDFIECDKTNYKRICKLLDAAGFTTTFGSWKKYRTDFFPFYINPMGKFWSTETNAGDNITLASEFLKPKKKDLINQELANFDNRLRDLELGFFNYCIGSNAPLLIKTNRDEIKDEIPVSELKTSFKDFMYVNSEGTGWVNMPERFVAKPELTELPDKWVVAVNENNYEVLTEWKKETSNNWFDAPAKKYDFISYRGEGLREIPFEHTKISFYDFERLVLNKPEELEVWKWYKLSGKNDKCLLYMTGFPNTAYGFDNIGRWNDQCSLWGFNQYSFVEASNEEVEVALKNEAIRRGFKEGCFFKAVGSPNAYEMTKVLQYKYNPETNELTALCDLGEYQVLATLFKDGQWAEIIEQPKEEIPLPYTNKNHLQFIYHRLTEVHGEPKNVDYMMKFKYIIDNMK